jgi:hypothetical protein
MRPSGFPEGLFFVSIYKIQMLQNFTTFLIKIQMFLQKTVSKYLTDNLKLSVLFICFNLLYLFTYKLRVNY